MLLKCGRQGRKASLMKNLRDLERWKGGTPESRGGHRAPRQWARRAALRWEDCTLKLRRARLLAGSAESFLYTEGLECPWQHTRAQCQLWRFLWSKRMVREDSQETGSLAQSGLHAWPLWSSPWFGRRPVGYVRLSICLKVCSQHLSTWFVIFNFILTHISVSVYLKLPLGQIFSFCSDLWLLWVPKFIK